MEILLRTLGCALLTVPLTAQVLPVINPGGIVNSASYNIASTSVAPGSIATIFGSNLSNGTVCVTPCGPTFDKNGILIPALAGATVTFSGVTAPVLSVPNSSQIAVQVPVEMAGKTSADVVVSVNGQTSTPVTVPISATAPGLFSVYASGSGLGAILNATEAGFGVVSLPGPWFDFPNSHTVQAGQVIEIYATGLGALTTAVATGTKPSGNPQTAATPTVTIGGAQATVQFAGETSCCVGLNQINVVMPSGALPNAPDRYHVPVQLSIGGQTSNTVTIAVAGYLTGLSGTVQTLNGSVNNGNVARLGLDVDPTATLAGSYALSGTGTSSAGQLAFSLTGSGSGTVSSCLLAGSTGSGTWSANGTMTLTLNQPGSGDLVGSYTATTTFTLCGTPLPPRVTNGGVLGGMNSAGAVTLTPVALAGGNAPWPLTGNLSTGVSGTLDSGNQIWNSNQVTGGITVTSSLQNISSGGAPSYTLTGNGNGTLPCSLVGRSGSGAWNYSVSATFSLSPEPATLVTTGGSVSGTYTSFTSKGTACGGSLGAITFQGSTFTGTVFPGGGIVLFETIGN